MIELLSIPFLQRALLGGMLVALMCSLLSIFVILRKQAYLADGVAHASLAGVALSFLLAGEPLFFAVIVGIIMAILITYVQKRTNSNLDNIIGIVYSLLFAIGIILLNLLTSYKPEISTYLFGSLLAISVENIILIGLFTIIVFFILFTQYRAIVYSTLDRTAAFIRGIKVNRVDYLLNICISIAVILAVKTVGIVLVTSLLIIPGSIAKLFALSFKQMIPISIIVGLLTFLGGLLLAYYFNLPPGAAIVVLGGSIYLVLVIIKKR